MSRSQNVAIIETVLSMNVGIFTDTYYPQLNGVTVSIHNFAKTLRQRGHKVYIFAPKVPGYHKKEKDVYRLHSFKVLSSEPEARVPLYVPDKTLQEVFRLDFDIIHAHGNGPFSLLGYQVAKIKRLPYVLTFHTLHTEYAHYFLDGKVIKPRVIATGLKVFANLCDGVITPSQKMQDKLKQFGVSKQIKVIPSFIDIKQYQSVKPGYLHRLLSLPQDTPLLLSVGRLGKEKNFAFLIKMFRLVAKADPAPHLVIVGQGPEKKALQQIVERYTLSERVHFTGAISSLDMPQVYKDASLFVFSSTTETQGICMLEAALSGLPLVAVSDAAFSDVLIPNTNGYALPLRQKVFADTILSLLKNEEQMTSFGKKSKDIARKHFNADTLTDELIAYYEDIITNYSSRQKVISRVNKAALVRLYRATSVLDRFLSK